MSNIEKYNFRDLRFGNMRRSFGDKHFNFDLDYYWVNKDAEPIAIFEEKHFNKKEIDMFSFQIKSQQIIANKLNVPFFIQITCPKGDAHDEKEFWGFYMIPANKLASKLLNSFTQSKNPAFLSQRKFYQFECFVRGYKPDENIMDRLETQLPEFYPPMVFYNFNSRNEIASVSA